MSRTDLARESARADRILFVHPPGPDRDLYVLALRETGLDTTVHDDMASATLASGIEPPPDLILTELSPEPRAAWAFIEKRRAEVGDLPVIILTSLIRPDRANRDRARALGCAAFVAKPCSVSQLVDVVGQVQRGS